MVSVSCVCMFFCFFKQRTAYEMRIGDWSSDVCSSDLGWMFDESGRARWLWQGWRLLSPAGFIALLAGWYVVEIGRQPYVVYGLLRTSEAVSPNITAAAVMSSLITYACAYALIFGAGTIGRAHV